VSPTPPSGCQAQGFKRSTTKNYFWVFSVVAKGKMFLVFSNLIKTKNKKTRGSVGKVFLIIKIRPGFMGSLVYSLIKVWWH
jgi:hypothetical protein